MLESMSILGKWSLLIAIAFSIAGIIFFNEENEEEIDFPDWVKDEDLFPLAATALRRLECLDAGLMD